MLGPYDMPPAFYGDKRGSQIFDWELRTRRIGSPMMTLGEEHIENLMQDARNQRRYSRLPHGVSLASRARANVQVWLDDARCRLHNLGFGQPCPEPAR